MLTVALCSSDRYRYHNQSKSWFLNDVVVATRGDGATQELYSTQLGPRGETDEFWLWRCTWDEENGEIVDGRLQADCGTVPGTASPSGPVGKIPLSNQESARGH